MPPDNIDFVRPIYEAWERSDWGSVDRAAPQIESQRSSRDSRRSLSTRPPVWQRGQ